MNDNLPRYIRQIKTEISCSYTNVLCTYVLHEPLRNRQKPPSAEIPPAVECFHDGLHSMAGDWGDEWI